MDDVFTYRALVDGCGRETSLHGGPIQDHSILHIIALAEEQHITKQRECEVRAGMATAY